MSSKTVKNTQIVAPTAVPTWIRDRRVWAIGGLVVVGIGLALKWDWLTAAGAAPVLLGLLPCVAMCALGLCMRGGPGRSCHNQSSETQPDPGSETRSTGR